MSNQGGVDGLKSRLDDGEPLGEGPVIHVISHRQNPRNK